VPTPAEEFEIREHGLALGVRLGDGLSTGLFLDQREARRRVRESVAGARVLNLFAYTCAFSAAAAAGGAACVVSVDASRDVLARGAQNVARARAESGTRGDDRFVRADAFEALARLAKSDERFDLVIVDPPTYATTRASRWTSGASWRGLVTQCARVLAPGGRLLASSNDRRLPVVRFRRLVQEGVRDADRAVTQLREVPLPRDFPVAAGREPHLKSLLVTLR
jgi:23S rRNA (cytosine1962-C5)-methyltransferase